MAGLVLTFFYGLREPRSHDDGKGNCHMPKASLKFVDLFCGAGGLSLGLKRAGFIPVVALDYDPAATETYKSNFSRVPVLTSDVRQVDWKRYRGQIDLVAGGPPCQPFSVAGDQKAATDSRDMVPEFVRAVRELKPRAFLLENVAGLASKRHRNYFLSKLEELASLDYHVAYEVLNAADFGVPQDRRRVIAIGFRKGQPLFPHPSHGPKGVAPYRTARQALVDAPSDEPNRAIVTYAKKPVMRPSPFAGMLVNGGGRPIDLDRPSQTIPASAGGNRTHIVDRKRILVDYHHYLLDGGRPKKGIVKGVRRLTVRESARLQSFPDDFVFAGERSAQYRQVGNAVPPCLSEAVGRAIYQSL
jgi:DNA (cytosine-5)-methyltransferase 1